MALSLIARFMGPTWGPLLAPWNLLSGKASHITDTSTAYSSSLGWRLGQFRFIEITLRHSWYLWTCLGHHAGYKIGTRPSTTTMMAWLWPASYESHCVTQTSHHNHWANLIRERFESLKTSWFCFTKGFLYSQWKPPYHNETRHITVTLSGCLDVSDHRQLDFLFNNIYINLKEYTKAPDCETFVRGTHGDQLIH